MSDTYPYAPSALDEYRDIQVEHGDDLALCAELEKVADGLPRLPAASVLDGLIERLSAATERWVARRWHVTLGESPAWQARLLDSVHAGDVIEALREQRDRYDHAQAGQLGYMLRALFDGRRRGVALERALLTRTSPAL